MSRIKILLAVFILFFISRAVFATSIVESEFEMLLPRQFQQNLIDRYWTSLQQEEFRFSWDIPDQTYDAPDAKVELKGLNLSVRSQLEKPNVGDSGETVLLRSRDLQATLNIRSIAIDQYIEREVGGVIGRFRVQAQCDNVNLNMKAGQGVLSMRLTPIFAGSVIRARVESVDLTWTSDAWSVGTLNCTGAQGFDDVIRGEVLKLAGNSAALVDRYKSTLFDYVQTYVNGKLIDISTPRFLPEIRPDIKVSLRLTGFEGTRTSSLVHGVFRVEFAKGKNQDLIFLKLEDSDFDENVTSGAILRIPEDFVVTLAKQAFVANSFIRRVSSERIPGFSSLMNSRLTQFIVWPELKRYPKSAKFLFDISTAKNISITGEDLSYTIQTGLHAQMYAPRHGKYVPFMDFAIPLKSDVKLTFAEGRVAAKFTEVRLDLIHSWKKSYIERYKPWKRFGRRKIVPRIQSAAQGAESSVAIPAIPVTEVLSMQVNRVVASPENKDLYIYLNEGAANPVPH